MLDEFEEYSVGNKQDEEVSETQTSWLGSMITGKNDSALLGKFWNLELGDGGF